MNKRELVDALATKLGITHLASQKYLNAFQEILGETLLQNEDIQLTGFGTFHPWEQCERPARNPKTGTPCMIAPRVSVKFKPGKFLLEKLNP